MKYERRKLLLPWMQKHVLDRWLDRCGEPSRREEVVSKWQEAVKLGGQLSAEEAYLGRTIEIREPGQEAVQRFEKIAASPQFKSLMHTGAQLKMVEVDKLVNLQPAVNLDYCDELGKRMAGSPSEEELVGFCFPPGQTLEPVYEQKAADGTFIFSSENTDLRVTDAISRPIEENDVLLRMTAGVPARVMSVVVGYGLPFVTAVAAARRVLLTNGLHRLHALRELGVKFAPALVINDPQNIGELYKLRLEDLMGGIRMPVMKDLFDTRLTAEVKVKTVRKVIRVKAVYEISEEPSEENAQQEKPRQADYCALAEAVLAKQVKVLGETVALAKAREVRGLQVEGSRVAGASKENLGELVRKYAELEGGFAVIAARKAVAPLLSGTEDLPEELK